MKAATNDEGEIDSSFDIADEVKDLKRSGMSDLQIIKILDDSDLIDL